jgi:vacuolar-type H+-ATPase subunit F/Vma7
MTEMGICAAVEEGVALGLNLAGVEEIFIWEKEMDVSSLKEWYRQMVTAGRGLMILSQRCGDILSHELFEKRVQGHMLPVVVVMPGDGEDKRTSDLIKRAIGMDTSNTVGGGGV